MPFYEYECASCKFYCEVMQRISDPPLTKCPSCGKSALKKLVSAPNFRLKGSGWYETDFKSEQETKRNLADADKSEKTTTEEAKPAAAESSAADAKPSEGKSADAKAPKGTKSASVSRPKTPAKPAKSRPAPPARRHAKAKSKAKARTARRGRR